MKALLLGLLKDPLLHFLVAGTALFLLLPTQTDLSSQQIAVSRTQLIEYMQGKARLYDGRSFAQAYDALSPAERRQLVDEYVRQEALYREARAIQLDEADPLVRNRLVQQMDLMVRDQALSGSEISAAEVAAYFSDHADDYARQATVTFTHVFIDSQRRPADADAVAARELQFLQRGNIAPEDALERGDRFPYQRNYAAMSQASLVPELGEEVAAAVFAAPIGSWTGPLRSPLGLHLIRVGSRTAAQTPAFAQVRDIVTRDALQAKRSRLGEEAVRRVVAGYQVETVGDIGQLAEPSN